MVGEPVHLNLNRQLAASQHPFMAAAFAGTPYYCAARAGDARAFADCARAPPAATRHATTPGALVVIEHGAAQ